VPFAPLLSLFVGIDMHLFHLQSQKKKAREGERLRKEEQEIGKKRPGSVDERFPPDPSFSHLKNGSSEAKTKSPNLSILFSTAARGQAKENSAGCGNGSGFQKIAGPALPYLSLLRRSAKGKKGLSF